MFTARFTSDGSLVQRARSGDRGAFGILVERHMRSVLALAFAHVRSRHDAEDVAQDAFVAAFEKLDTLREPQRFAAWLAAIVRNRAGRVRERRLHEANLTDRDSWREESVTPDPARAELLERVRTELDRLDDGAREVLVLYYFAGRSAKEIAATLDITPVAARKRLQRAREAMAERLLADAAEEMKPDRKRLALVLAALPRSGDGQTAAMAGPGLGMIAAIGIPALIVAAAVAIAGRPSPQQPEGVGGFAATATRETTEAPPARLASETREAVAVSPASSDTSETIPESNVMIRGRVADANGDLLSGARVRLKVIRHFLDDTYDSSDPVQHESETRTGSDGRFRFEGIPATAGRYQTAAVWAEGNGQAGFASTSLSLLEKKQAGHADEWPIVVQQTGDIAGRVTTESGEPVAGAMIVPWAHFPVEPGQAWLRDTLEYGHGAKGESASDGTFRLEGLPAGGWTLRISAPGFAASWTETLATGTEHDAILLLPEQVVTGVVRDGESGVPATGVMVGIETTDEADRVSFHSAVSDSHGAYRIDGLGAGAHWVVTRAAGYWSAPQSFATASRDSDPKTVDIVVRAAPPVGGRLVDAQTGTPIAGVPVSVRMLGKGPFPVDEPFPSAVSGNDGAFDFNGLRPGTYALDYKFVPAMPVKTIAIMEAAPRFTVTEERGADVDWPVLRTQRISGRVTHDGVPVAGAVVSLLSDNIMADYVAGFDVAPPVVLSDANGAFTAYFDRPLPDITLQAVADNLTSAIVGPLLSRLDSDDPVVLALQPAGIIAGRVENAAGYGVHGAAITVRGARGLVVRRTLGTGTPPHSRFELMDAIFSREDGRFVLNHLPPDTYTIEANGLRRVITLDAGASVRDVRLSPEPTGPIIRGRTYVAGKPAGNVRIVTATESVNSRQDGSFALDGSACATDRDGRPIILAGAVTEMNGLRTIRTITVPLSAIDPDVEVALRFAEGTNRFEGTVELDRHLALSANLILKCETDVGEETALVYTGVELPFRIEGIPDGVHTYYFASGIGESGGFTLDVAGGETAYADVDLRRATCRVTLQSGKGWEDVLCFLYAGEAPEILDAERCAVSPAAFSAGNEAALTTLPGRFTLAAGRVGEPPLATATVDLAPGATTEVVLRP